MIADGLSTLHYIIDLNHGAVRLNVGALRLLGLQVGWDPDGGHQHHGAVWGVKSSMRKKVKKLAVTVKRALGES